MQRIIRLPEVVKSTGLARSTIYKKIMEGNFPKPIALGSKSVGWVESDIENWIQGRISESKIELKTTK